MNTEFFSLGLDVLIIGFGLIAYFWRRDKRQEDHEQLMVESLNKLSKSNKKILKELLRQNGRNSHEHEAMTKLLENLSQSFNDSRLDMTEINTSLKSHIDEQRK